VGGRAGSVALAAGASAGAGFPLAGGRLRGVWWCGRLARLVAALLIESLLGGLLWAGACIATATAPYNGDTTYKLF
jgi:hypothetical protein